MAFARRRRIRPAAIDPATGRRISPWPFVGLCLVVSSLFLYGASGLLAPAWAVVLLLATWLVMFVLCFVWWSRPLRVVALGVIAYVWWFVAVTAGGILLDWNA